MLKYLIKNFKTLSAAIGNEAPSHILKNAWRKLTGQTPLAAEHFGMSYKKYCKARAQVMRARQIDLSKRHSISILWIVKSADVAKLKTSYRAIKKQRFSADEIIWVSNDQTLAQQFTSDAQCKDLNEAIRQASGNYLILLHDSVQVYDTFIQEVHWQLQSEGQKDILYACEDQLDSSQKRNTPVFKPALNLSLIHI